MPIFPIDDPQDTLATDLPDGYPWDHEAPPSTEPALRPGWDGVRPIVGIVTPIEPEDDPLPSMRGAGLGAAIALVDRDGDEPLPEVDDGAGDETERRIAWRNPNGAEHRSAWTGTEGAAKAICVDMDRRWPGISHWAEVVT